TCSRSPISSLPERTSSTPSASPNQAANLDATCFAPESSIGPGGIRARRRTSGAMVSASRRKSRPARAETNVPAGSVAEDRRALIADPLPERCRAAELRIRDELVLLELAGVETDGAHEQLPAPVGVLLDQPGQRRAAVARQCLRVSRHREPDGLLG